MAKMTLLEMVQSTLGAMDSDDVNSIDETVESAQVAQFAKECYFELISQRDWSFLRTQFSLIAVGDLTRPTTMKLEEGYSTIEWVKYNKQDVSYLDPKAFTDMIDMRVEQPGYVDANGFIINRDPLYYTTFDDEYFVFDAYDSADDDTLVTSKCICFGSKVPNWSHSDAFIPDMPAKMFPMLLAEIKSVSFLNLKQQANALEARRSQRGRNIFQNEMWRNSSSAAKWNSAVNYGRK